MLKPEDFEVTLDMHRRTIELEVRVEVVAKLEFLINENAPESLPDLTDDLVRRVLKKIYGDNEKDRYKWQRIVRDAIGLNNTAQEAFHNLMTSSIPEPKLIAKRIKNKKRVGA